MRFSGLYIKPLKAKQEGKFDSILKKIGQDTVLEISIIPR
jgi:hypothetical protein